MEIGSNGGVHKSKEKEWETTRGTKTGRSELLLRVLALLLTLTAAILLGLDKQTKVVPIAVFPSLPPVNVPVTAKFSHVSAFVYSVVTNSIASAFAIVSLALTLGSNKGGFKLLMMILVVDLVMVALLFSGIGATSAIGIIGLKGNTHLQWNKVCNVYGKFCHQVAASVALSLLGAIISLFLVILTASKIQKRA